MTPGYQRWGFGPEFGHHLAGLIDGEGHFGIVAHAKPYRGKGIFHRPRTTGYTCIFAMDMRDDDTAVLEMLHERTGLGKRYNSGPRNQGPQRLDAKPVEMWRVHDKDGCLELVAILEEYRLWTKKARDFHIWAKAVRYWNSDKPQGWEPMEKWWAEIRAIREYNRDVPERPSYEVETWTLFDDLENE